MIAGVLEYALLGFGFHVGILCFILEVICVYKAHSNLYIAKLPEYLPGRHSNLSRVHQCWDRLLSDPKVRGHLGVFSGYDPPFVSCCPGRDNRYNSGWRTCQRRSGPSGKITSDPAYLNRP